MTVIVAEGPVETLTSLVVRDREMFLGSFTISSFLKSTPTHTLELATSTSTSCTKMKTSFKDLL